MQHGGVDYAKGPQTLAEHKDGQLLEAATELDLRRGQGATENPIGNLGFQGAASLRALTDCLLSSGGSLSAQAYERTTALTVQVNAAWSLMWCEGLQAHLLRHCKPMQQSWRQVTLTGSAVMIPVCQF